MEGHSSSFSPVFQNQDILPIPKNGLTKKKSSFVARVVLTKHMTKARPKLELSGCFRVSMESIGRLMNIDWIG